MRPMDSPSPLGPVLPQALRAALARLAVESNTAGYPLAHALLCLELNPGNGAYLEPLARELLALASNDLDSLDREGRNPHVAPPVRTRNLAGLARGGADSLSLASQVMALLAESLTEMAGIEEDAAGNDPGFFRLSTSDPDEAPDPDAREILAGPWHCLSPHGRGPSDPDAGGY